MRGRTFGRTSVRAVRFLPQLLTDVTSGERQRGVVRVSPKHHGITLIVNEKRVSRS